MWGPQVCELGVNATVESVELKLSNNHCKDRKSKTITQESRGRVSSLFSEDERAKFQGFIQDLGSIERKLQWIQECRDQVNREEQTHSEDTLDIERYSHLCWEMKKRDEYLAQQKQRFWQVLGLLKEFESVLEEAEVRAQSEFSLEHKLDEVSSEYLGLREKSDQIEKNLRRMMNRGESTHHDRWLMITLVRCEFRILFGADKSQKCGQFLDREMCKLIDLYGSWVNYHIGHQVLRSHTDRVNAVCVSKNGRYAYTAGRDSLVVVWDLLHCRVLYQWVAHTNHIGDLVCHSGFLVSGGEDTLIQVWSAVEYSLIRTLKGHSDTVTSLNFNREGTLLVSGSMDCTIREWSVHSGECLRVFRGHFDDVRCVLLVGEMLVSGACDGSVRVWTPKEASRLKIISHDTFEEEEESVYHCTLNCDRTLLACVTSKSIVLLGWPGLRVIHSMIAARSCSACFFPTQPRWLAIGLNMQRSVQVWDVLESKCIRRFDGHSCGIRQLCFSPCGMRLISVSGDCSARFWDLTDLYH